VLGNTVIQICEKTVVAEPEMPVVDPPIYTDKMDKEKAYFLLRKNLVSITKPFTYASLNKNGAIYWANPSTAVLKKDWWIVLNDSKKGELHYLMIPKNQFTEKDFKIRKDKNAIDFQVTYGSKNFFDSRSQISFVQFHKGTIKY
jgi:hypothetical protein